MIVYRPGRCMVVPHRMLYSKAFSDGYVMYTNGDMVDSVDSTYWLYFGHNLERTVHIFHQGLEQEEQPSV